MSELSYLNVEALRLDLNNHRTVHQDSEVKAVKAMVSTSADRFWALMESILDDGYHPSDNVLVLATKGGFVVHEGNRRVAALKIIGKLIEYEVPANLQKKIAQLPTTWVAENGSLPCLVFQEHELVKLKKMVSLIHAKGQKAGRDQWTAVARTRYDRDELGVSSHSLDLLEAFLLDNQKLSENQIESWSGDYPITVLDEALPKLNGLLGFDSVEQLVSKYPKKNRVVLDKILHDIGTKNLGFKDLRAGDKVGIRYGLISPTPTSTQAPGAGSLPASPNPQPSGGGVPAPVGGAGGPNPTPQGSGASPSGKPVAMSANDPVAVAKILSEFQPTGNGREKVVALLEELRRLKADKYPHAFCFLLRSLFEISAKVYCDENKASGCPPMTTPSGDPKKLASALGDIVTFMTNGNKDLAKVKVLHGAKTELGKSEGLLSETSMNNLVHNTTFSIAPNDICILFGNVFPLLKALNS